MLGSKRLSVKGKKGFCLSEKGMAFEEDGGESVGDERDLFRDGLGGGSGEEKVTLAVSLEVD